MCTYSPSWYASENKYFVMSYSVIKVGTYTQIRTRALLIGALYPLRNTLNRSRQTNKNTRDPTLDLPVEFLNT